MDRHKLWWNDKMFMLLSFLKHKKNNILRNRFISNKGSSKATKPWHPGLKKHIETNGFIHMKWTHSPEYYPQESCVIAKNMASRKISKIPKIRRLILGFLLIIKAKMGFFPIGQHIFNHPSAKENPSSRMRLYLYSHGYKTRYSSIICLERTFRSDCLYLKHSLARSSCLAYKE